MPMRLARFLRGNQARAPFAQEFPVRRLVIQVSLQVAQAAVFLEIGSRL